VTEWIAEQLIKVVINKQLGLQSLYTQIHSASIFWDPVESWGKRTINPKAIYDLIFKTYEYITLQGKRDFEAAIKDFAMDRLSQMINVYPMYL
jgi:hypothetical protein